MEKISTGKRSSAAGPKEHRWALFECGAGERGNSKTYEVRTVVFQFLESTRSGTPRDQWMKGESKPVWDHGSRGSWGRASSQWKRGHPWTCCFGVEEPASRKGECGWENSTEYRCTPTRTFLKVFTVVETSSDCCNYGSSRSIGSRANQTNWLNTEPNLEWKGAAASASWWGPPGRDSVVVWL